MTSKGSSIDSDPDTLFSYRPLERSQLPGGNLLCRCMTCYPYEVEDDTSVDYPEGGQWHDHPYLAPRADNILGRAV